MALRCRQGQDTRRRIESYLRALCCLWVLTSVRLQMYDTISACKRSQAILRWSGFRRCLAGAVRAHIQRIVAVKTGDGMRGFSSRRSEALRRIGSRMNGEEE